MPKEVQRVSCEYEQDVQPIGNQTWDWQEKQHRLVWKHKKVKGSTEWTLRVCCSACAILHVTSWQDKNLVQPCSLLSNCHCHPQFAMYCACSHGGACAIRSSDDKTCCTEVHLPIVVSSTICCVICMIKPESRLIFMTDNMSNSYQAQMCKKD